MPVREQMQVGGAQHATGSTKIRNEMESCSCWGLTRSLLHLWKLLKWMYHSTKVRCLCLMAVAAIRVPKSLTGLCDSEFLYKFLQLSSLNRQAIAGFSATIRALPYRPINPHYSLGRYQAFKFGLTIMV